MATLGDMKARIARELARGSSLTTSIAEAINTAITAYSAERFGFNETQPNAEAVLNTVANKSVYDAAALGRTIFELDYLMALIGGMWQPLDRKFPEDVKLLNDNGNMKGQPSAYSWEGQALMIYPVPDQVYQIRLAGIFSYAAPETDIEPNNRWMNECELLIRSRAKYEIAKHVTRNKDMQADMNPENPGGAAYDAFIDLKRRTNRIKATGRIQAMQF